MGRMERNGEIAAFTLLAKYENNQVKLRIFMPKKHPTLTYEFFVEDLDSIPQELDDLMDAIDLALLGKGEQLADMILTSDVLDLMPKELISEFFRNTKKSPRPTKATLTELDLKNPLNTEAEICLTGRSRSFISSKAREQSRGRPTEEDNCERNTEIFKEYKRLIKTLAKWQCLKELSIKYHLSESSIEDILKQESALDRHGYVPTGGGRGIARRWFLYGRNNPEMGEKSE